MLANTPYNALTDFDFISIPVQAQNVLLAPPDQQADSIEKVIALRKEKPGEVSFASSGRGSCEYLSAELFWQQTGTNSRHIRYRGGAQPSMICLAVSSPSHPKTPSRTALHQGRSLENDCGHRHQALASMRGSGQ